MRLKVCYYTYAIPAVACLPFQHCKTFMSAHLPFVVAEIKVHNQQAGYATAACASMIATATSRVAAA